MTYRIAWAGNGCDQAFMQTTVPLETAALGSGESDADMGHPTAEAVVALPVGLYFVCADPITQAGGPSAVCGEASQIVSVASNTTTEATFVSMCDQANGGTVDLTTILNDPPEVEGVEIAPTEFLTTCDAATVTATASDPNGDPIDYDWLVTQGAAWITPEGSTATFGPALAGDYELTVGASDPHGARTARAFPIHVTDDASCVPAAPDLSAITQLYCNGACGSWGGGIDCQQADADVFCRIKTNDPNAVAESFEVAPAAALPGICCPNTVPNTDGCVDVGVLPVSGTTLDVSVHPNNLLASHGAGNVVTHVVCTTDAARSCAGLDGTECQGSDCCESALVDGGSFTEGPDQGGMSFASTLSSFRLDVYEVTVARFRAFLDKYDAWHAHNPVDGDGGNPHVQGSGWNSAWPLPTTAVGVKANLHCTSPQYETWAEAGHDSLPINCVNWYTALAFCIWDRGRLPTEAEFEYAASGGSNDSLYPWGNTPVPTDLQDSTASYATYNCLADGSAAGSCDFADILAVGSKPAGRGRYGQQDLGGSMWEWELDWYGAYPASAKVNYAKVDTGTFRSVRGGSWAFDALYLATGSRSNNFPDARFTDIGFRCARDP